MLFVEVVARGAIGDQLPDDIVNPCCNIVGSAIGAINAGKNARRSRDQAQGFLDQALGAQPTPFNFGGDQQSALLQALFSNATAQAPQLEQSFFSKGLENRKVRQLTEDVGDFSNQLQSQLDERNARRGLFRSGIAAQQSREAGADLSGQLGRNVTNLRLGFQQNRANEAQNRFRLNLGAQQSQQQNLLNAINQGNLGFNQQQSIFGNLLGLVPPALGAAGSAQQAQGQAFGQLGSSIGGIGQTAFLGSLLGGTGGPSGGGFNIGGVGQGQQPFNVGGFTPGQFTGF